MTDAQHANLPVHNRHHAHLAHRSVRATRAGIITEAPAADAVGIDVIAVRGGEGGWIGTAFLTCPEADTPAESRQAVIEVATTDTVWSRVFDIGPVRSGPENDVTPARYRVGVR